MKKFIEELPGDIEVDQVYHSTETISHPETPGGEK